MAFEDSPNLNGSAVRRDPIDWILAHRRMILIGAASLGIVTLAFIGMVWLAHRPPNLPYGGLDGCLQTGEGAPIAATVEVAGQSTTTYADGCFFFAALPSGSHTLRIRISDKVIWQDSVAIEAGQATALETLSLRSE